MPRKGHSEEQIVYALRQAEAGKKVYTSPYRSGLPFHFQRVPGKFSESNVVDWPKP